MVVIGLPCQTGPCKCSSCDYALDTYARADNSDINVGAPTSYTTITGAFVIASGYLDCTTANSLVLCNTADDSGDSKVGASLTFIVQDTGDIVYLIIKSNSAATDYWAVKIVVNDQFSGGELAIIHYSSGSETVKTSAPLSTSEGDTITITICYDGTWLAATGTNTSNIVKIRDAESSLGGSLYAGIAVTTLGSEFDASNFEFWRGESGTNPSCPVCHVPTKDCGGATYPSGALCPSLPVPTQLDVQINGGWTVHTGSTCAACTSLNGAIFTVTSHTPSFDIPTQCWNGVGFSEPTIMWRYTGPDGFCTGNSTSHVLVEISLCCGSSDGGDTSNCYMKVGVQVLDAATSVYSSFEARLPSGVDMSSGFSLNCGCLTTECGHSGVPQNCDFNTSYNVTVTSH